MSSSTRIYCGRCGKVVSSPVPADIVVRAWVECPECIERGIEDEPDRGLLDGAMHSVWLHGDWRWLTSKMTTEERDAAADAVLRYNHRINEPGNDPLTDEDLRWWRS